MDYSPGSVMRSAAADSLEGLDSAFFPEAFTKSATAEAAARFKALQAARLPIPDDLAAFVVEVLQRAAGASQRLQLRNQHIAAAAALLQGPPFTRARALAKQAALRTPERLVPLKSLAGQLRRALVYARLPKTAKQFATIISTTNTWKSSL